MKKSRTYQLRRFDDLFEIPDDRLDACLQELAEGIRRLRPIRERALALAAQRGGFLGWLVRRFGLISMTKLEWTDDEAGDLDVIIRGVQNEPLAAVYQPGVLRRDLP